MENKSVTYQESEFSFSGQITKSNTVEISGSGVRFPGALDRGTPLVIKENNKNTIIGKNTLLIIDF